MPFKRKLDRCQSFKKQPGGAVKPWLTCQQIQLHHTRMCYQSAAVYRNILVVSWSPESELQATGWLTTHLGVPQSQSPRNRITRRSCLYRALACITLPPGGRFRTRTDIITDHLLRGRTRRWLRYQTTCICSRRQTCVLSDSVPITSLKSERAFGVSVGDVWS